MAFNFPKNPATTGQASVPASKVMTQVQQDQEYMRQQDEKRAAASKAPAPSTPPPSRAAAPPPAMRPPAAYPGDEGVGDIPADDGRGRLLYADTFSDLAEGRYTFLCCVEGINHWDKDPVIALRVRVGDDKGREFRWEQTPPFYCRADPNGGAAVHWRRRLFEAYAAGGWTAQADESRGWPGWARNGQSYTPPYADFFVIEIDGRAVPVLLAVTVQVDKGYEGRPKIIAVRHHEVDGSLVQAPLPRKLTPWIAERHRWSGVRKDMTVKPTEKREGYVVPSTEPTWDQIPRGFGGLLTLKDCKLAIWRHS